MIKTEIVPGLWRLSFPWIANPSAQTAEVYVINGKQDTLVVDVGKSSVVEPVVLMRAIESTGAHMDSLKVFLTHYHIDHCENIGFFLSEGITVIGGGECEPVTPVGEDRRLYFADITGIPEERRDDRVYNYIELTYPHQSMADRISVVDPGTVINVDPWQFDIIRTPGHSLDSCCLFDWRTGILISGDTIIGGFVPPVNTTSLNSHMLQLYFESLKRLRHYPIRMVLPGHQDPIVGELSSTQQIEKIGKTYKRRVRKTESILNERDYPCTAYELICLNGLGQKDLKNESTFYIISHVTMTLSYLEYLYSSGRVKRKHRGKAVEYQSLAANDKGISHSYFSMLG